MISALKKAISRRIFLRKSTIAAAATAAATSPLSPLLIENAEAGNFSAIADLLSIDPVSLQYAVGGPCCWYCPNVVFVTHMQPVGIVEVLKSSNDGFVPGGQIIGGSTSSVMGSTAVDRNDRTSFSARIWGIPSWALSLAMAFQDCKLCGESYAQSFKSSVGGFMNYICPGSSKATGAAIKTLNSNMPACLPRLFYDSNLDTDWRFGCRDMGKGVVSSVCGVANMTGGLGAEMGISMGTMTQGFGIDPPCIGSWGSTYPRQMTVIQDDPRIAAAVTAVRAVSVASELGQFPFRTNWGASLLQQVRPFPTVGRPPGSLTGLSQVIAAPADIQGNYCYVWWTRVACCKSYTDVFGLCSPAGFVC